MPGHFVPLRLPWLRLAWGTWTSDVLDAGATAALLLLRFTRKAAALGEAVPATLRWIGPQSSEKLQAGKTHHSPSNTKVLS